MFRMNRKNVSQDSTQGRPRGECNLSAIDHLTIVAHYESRLAMASPCRKAGNRLMDIDAKNLACRAVLTMAVFLLPAAGAAWEQGPPTLVPAPAEPSLLAERLTAGAFRERLSRFPHSFVPTLAPAPAPLQLFHSLWLSPPKSLVPTPPAASPYPALPPEPVPAPLTASPGPTPGDTLLPENATYYRVPADLILPDEHLSDEAFRTRLSYYLPSFGGTPEQILDDFKFQQVGDHWDGINTEHAYARGLSGRGVRIGIVDTGVDILHPEFAGRVQRRGTFIVNKIYFPEDLPEAFSGCQEEGAECRVFEIDASGDRALIEHYAHRIIEAERRFPDEYETWFIRDLSRDADGWHAIPELYDEIVSINKRLDHGTLVASAAAGWRYGIAPGATIRPLLEEAVWRTYFFENLHLAGDDASGAQAYRDYLSHSDIINYSVGSHPDNYDSQVNTEAWYKRDFPAFWAAFTQRDAQEKTIIVWAADNLSRDQPGSQASLPAREPAVRGHWLAVAAAEYGNRSNSLNDSALRIANYSHRCGPLPGDWNPQAHGRHYCLTAPGNVRAALPNVNPPPGAGASHLEVNGTSYAAPLVAGGIALVMERFRGQLSNREVALRVINTANNRGHYSDSRIYGAGVLDLDAATAPVGEVSTGTAAMQAAIAATRLQTPAAWGDLGQRLQGLEIAGFDSWNAPFWYPAQALARPYEPPLLPPRPALDPVFEQTALLPQLRWFELDATGPQDRRRWRLAVANRAAADFDPGQTGFAIGQAWRWRTFGFSGDLPGGLRLGMLTEAGANQGARPAGAFGAAANSQLAWLSREHAWPLSWAGGVALRLNYLLAAGRPDYPRGALFKAGGSLYSAASLALEHRGAETRTRLSIGQPLRAESGRGTLRYAVGRDRAGNWRYEQLRFALRPETREVRFQLRHDRPLFKGQLAVELSYAHNADHVPGQHRAQAGLGYRRVW